MSQHCNHTFSPTYPDFIDYTHKGDDGEDRSRWLLGENVPGVEDGTWSCPHEALPGYDKCPFHLPVAERPDDLNVTAEFLGHIKQAQNLESRKDRQRKTQFIDATFENFNISGEVLDTGTNHYINLAHANIADANLTDTLIRQPVRFSHATFEDESRFNDAIFEGFVDMRNSKFLAPARFKGAIFNRPFSVRHAEFVENAYFWHTIFKQYATFRDVDFREYAYFRGVDFEKYVRFSQAHFHDEAKFKLGEFGDDADFIHTRFDGSHSFTDAEFERTTDFSGVRASGPMDLSGATLETLEMTPEKIDCKTQYVDLSGSVIKEGELSQPDEGDILYDAEGATLGDVSVTTPSNESAIEHIRLVATSFDGFEFESDDMNPEVAEWRVHTVFDDSVLPADRRGEPSPDTLRETYLKAKNGARQVGNTAASGHFYYKEMKYRRKYLAEITISGGANGFSTGFAWLRNTVLWIVTGYGEYPLRVVGSSVGIILGFTGLYQLLGSTDTPIVESALFSAQSFITFIVGSPPQETTDLIAAASIIQGFIGAFFIALFVYAFTRKLNR